LLPGKAGRNPARFHKEATMYPYSVLSIGSIGPYPNSALSPGQLAIIAVIPVLALAIWLIGVFFAAREPRHRDAVATTSLAQLPQTQEQRHSEPERRAA
jgi:hypothetical protein